MYMEAALAIAIGSFSKSLVIFFTIAFKLPNAARVSATKQRTVEIIENGAYYITCQKLEPDEKLVIRAMFQNGMMSLDGDPFLLPS